MRQTLMMFLLGLVVLICQPNAHAATVHPNWKVRVVFAEQSATRGAGFYPNVDISSMCLWGLMYVDLSTAAGRSMLGLLQQAKAMNQSLVRVDYVVDPPPSGTSQGTCTVTGLHVE